MMIYDQIREYRLKYKISQSKLAESSGFSKAKISNWELKKETPTGDELLVLKSTLDKIVLNINSGKIDIRKKRVVHGGAAKTKLPKMIKTVEEYKSLMEKKKASLFNQYRDTLSKLYDSAIKDKTQDSPKAIALFSGCGGFSLGFAAEGYNLVGHLDIEDSANVIYENNFRHSKLLGKDICKITDNDIDCWKKEFGTIDILLGGPPCQGFSLAGKRDPGDARNELYSYYVNIVSKLRPKVFVMENVRLLTSMRQKNGTLFINTIINSFKNCGYEVSVNEINAMDYGVPQSRERVILVGVRRDLNKRFIMPHPICDNNEQKNLFSNYKRVISFRDATGDLPLLESGEISDDPLHWCVSHPQHVIEWLKDVPEGCSAHDNKDPNLRPPSGFNTTYKRILWDEPCSTISTNFSMISGCRNVHPVSTRSLTIREATRAQSFPDEFIFTGKWGDIRKAIGNAVPPLLAQVIALAIKEQIFDN